MKTQVNKMTVNKMRVLLAVLSLLSTLLPQSALAQTPISDEFNPGADDYVYSLAVQVDGKILQGGQFTMLGGQPRDRLARLNADGTLDSGFNPGADKSVSCLALQPDGKILVAGEFNTLGGQLRDRLARLNADGTLDSGFNPGASNVTSLAMQPDGKILVGGNFTSLGGQPRNYIGRLNADGSLDNGFNPGASNVVYSLAMQPDGKILVGGNFTTLGGQPRDRLARLNADGTLDSGFNPGADRRVYSLVVQADGKILVGGAFTTIGGQEHKYIARLNADGTPDSEFNPGGNGGLQAKPGVFSIAMQVDGKILVGGEFSTMGGQPRSRIARLNADGTLDSAFNPGANVLVFSLAVQSDGKILVGGGFDTLGGHERSQIGRLNNTGPATQSLSHDGSTITWLRGGTSPEVWRTSFEYSADGATWSNLGAGSRIPGGWHLTGVPVPLGGLVRARGYIAGGQYNASAWFVETRWPPQPRLTDPHWLNTTNFAFTLLAETNLIYRIDSSSDLTSWSEALRLTNPPPSVLVELPVAPGQSPQFFRTVIP